MLLEKIETIVSENNFNFGDSNVVILDHKNLADELCKQFGKFGIEVISHEQATEQFLSISPGKKNSIGMRFAVVNVERNFVSDRYMKKGSKKNPNPFFNTDKKFIEQYSMMVMLNVNAGKKLESVATNEYKSQDFRNNGLKNYDDGNAVIAEKNGNIYLSYIVLKYLTDKKIINETGKEISSDEKASLYEWLKSSYLPENKKAGMAKQAEKMGIAIEELPQVRQMSLENIAAIKIFGKTYIPK